MPSFKLEWDNPDDGVTDEVVVVYADGANPTKQSSIEAVIPVTGGQPSLRQLIDPPPGRRFNVFARDTDAPATGPLVASPVVVPWSPDLVAVRAGEDLLALPTVARLVARPMPANLIAH